MKAKNANERRRCTHDWIAVVVMLIQDFGSIVNTEDNDPKSKMLVLQKSRKGCYFISDSCRVKLWQPGSTFLVVVECVLGAKSETV